jgi:hypothetical protein
VIRTFGVLNLVFLKIYISNWNPDHERHFQKKKCQELRKHVRELLIGHVSWCFPTASENLTEKK